jgi:hypothetical protein
LGTAVIKTDVELVPAGGSAGQVLAKASGTAYDTAWVEPTFNSEGWHPSSTGSRVGQFGNFGVNQADHNFGVNRLYVWPCVVSESVTVTDWWFRVTTGNSAGNTVVRAGIYETDDSFDLLGDLVVDLGTVTVNTSATGQFFQSCNFTLSPGYYFMAFTHDRVLSYRGMQNANRYFVRNTGNSFAFSAEGPSGGAPPANALPDPLPSISWAVSNIPNSGPLFFVWS